MSSDFTRIESAGAMTAAMRTGRIPDPWRCWRNSITSPPRTGTWCSSASIGPVIPVV